MQVRNLPVVSEGKVMGIVNVNDVSDFSFSMEELGGKKAYMKNISERKGLPKVRGDCTCVFCVVRKDRVLRPCLVRVTENNKYEHVYLVVVRMFDTPQLPVKNRSPLAIQSLQLDLAGPSHVLLCGATNVA